jgi:hypothetical protein
VDRDGKRRKLSHHDPATGARVFTEAGKRFHEHGQVRYIVNVPVWDNFVRPERRRRDAYNRGNTTFP